MPFKKKKNQKTLRARSSRKVYLPLYLMVAIIICILIFIYRTERQINSLALVGVICFIFLIFKLTEIHRLENLYEINPTSFVHTKGLINTISRRLDLFAISDLDVSQTAWQRLLNIGDVNVRMFSKDTTTSAKKINNPTKFARFLEETITRRRRSVTQKENGKE